MDSVYLETTVVGNVAGRIHPNPDVASRQHKTRRWWATAKSDYRLFISQLALDECGAGDPTAAQERIDEIGELPRLDITDDVRNLANALMTGNAIPRSEPRDALHVAIAAVHGVEYLVTWNFKHIANATLRTKINDVIRNNGYEPPIICTPEELAGMTDAPNDTD
jgi:predicted nucleic acid-binding protein